MGTTFIFPQIFIDTSGIYIVLNPIFSASLIRFSRNITFFIFPVRDISPINISDFFTALFHLLDIIEAAIARSIPGSSKLSQRAMLQYTS